MSNETPAPTAQATPKAEAPAVESTVLTAEATVTPPEAKKVVPEKYEFKAPEGSQLDAAEVEKVSAFAKAKGLSQDEASLILEQRTEAKKSFEESQQTQFKEKAQAWVSELMADKEVGGDAFKENVETAKRALETFGSPELRKALDQTGLGNNPELFKMMLKIGRQIKEDKTVMGGAGPAKSSQALEQVFYGKTTEN